MAPPALVEELPTIVPPSRYNTLETVFAPCFIAPPPEAPAVGDVLSLPPVIIPPTISTSPFSSKIHGPVELLVNL